MLVLDASAILLGLLRAGEARQVMAREQLVTSHLADAEVPHVLRRQALSGTLSETEARELLATYQDLAVVRHSSVGLFERVWSLRENLTAYDATYVALAESVGCPLVSGDRRLLSAPGLTCDTVLVDS